MHRLGIGLAVVDDNGVLTEMAPPLDLSMNIALPPLARHRIAVRREVAIVHGFFDRGDWRHGFEEACKLVENAAREYLRKQVRNGSLVTVQGKKGIPKKLTVKIINRLTLGQLADAFCQMMKPKAIDALLCSGLKAINPDRINVAHRKMDKRAERRLRENVGRHMWNIDNLLRNFPV